MLFDSYEAWAARQGDLKDEIAKTIDTHGECIHCDGGSELSREFKCTYCKNTGHGELSKHEIEQLVDGKLRAIYERQLENDYRNALHMLGAA
jgi:hypothetical protein